MGRILVPGRTCAEVLRSADAGLLVDGRDYYRAVYQAARQARRRLLILGWQLDTDVPLLRGDDARDAIEPVELLRFLGALCDARPELEVHVLAWDPSPLFLLEREPLQARAFARRGHRRLRFAFDRNHPIGGSHHQKLIVVDRSVAFLGGMDVCSSRWDCRDHAAGDPRRLARFGQAYGPYHDVQAYVTGDAVDLLTDWFVERWRGATGRRPRLAPVRRRAIRFDATRRIAAPRIGLARTLPRVPGRAAAVEELRALHVAAIASARRLIYLENQYLTADDVRAALLDQLRRPATPPLEVVLILPERTKAVKEQLTIGVRQAFLLRELAAAAAAGGHHLGAYYPTSGPGDDAAPVYVHAKVLAVDDRLLLVSSANATNRSMGLDSELGVAWESARPSRALRDARVDLLGEHAGLDDDALAPISGLVARLDERARAGAGRLRPHPMEETGRAVELLGPLLPDDFAIDPDGPVLDDALWEATEGGTARPLLDRLTAAWRALRDGLAGTSIARRVGYVSWSPRVGRRPAAVVPHPPRRG